MMVSKSGFYKYITTKDEDYSHLVSLEKEIKKIHTLSRGTYGRRILSTLRKSFIKIGRKRFFKIMHKLDLWGIGEPKFNTTTKLDR